MRLYDRLFSTENPTGRAEAATGWDNLNPESLEVLTGCKLEPSVAVHASETGWRCQFERLGYFCVDQDSTTDKPVFNRTIGLRDSWAKLERKSGSAAPIAAGAAAFLVENFGGRCRADIVGA